MKSSVETFKGLLVGIEKTLAHYYCFELRHSVVHHLIDRWEDNPEQSQVIVSTDDESCFLGVYFPQNIREKIVDKNPSVEITLENLNDFWVLVEEVSHFHLIAQRGFANRFTKLLELEIQAELDKIILSSLWLKQQSSYHHFEALCELLFNRCIVFSLNSELYYRAQKAAAVFWKTCLSNGLGKRYDLFYRPFRSLMADLYRQSLQVKYSLLAQQHVF